MDVNLNYALQPRILFNNKWLVQKLLQEGADDLNCLCVAIHSFKNNMIKLIIKYLPKALGHLDETNFSALEYAASIHNLEAVKTLICAEIDSCTIEFNSHYEQLGRNCKNLIMGELLQKHKKSYV